MLLQLRFAVFRVIQMIQDKAQSDENGRVLIQRPQRFKNCNAGLDFLDRSLRASRQAFVRVVGFLQGVESLGNDGSLPASLALRPNVWRLAEHRKSKLKEH